MICPLTDRPTAIEVEVRHTTGVGLGVAVVRRKGVGVVRSKGVGVVRGKRVGVRRSKSVGVVRRTGVGVWAALLAAKPSTSTTATNPPKRPSRSRRWVLRVYELTSSERHAAAGSRSRRRKTSYRDPDKWGGRARRLQSAATTLCPHPDLAPQSRRPIQRSGPHRS